MTWEPRDPSLRPTDPTPCAATVTGGRYTGPGSFVKGRPCKRRGIWPVGWHPGGWRLYACKQHKNGSFSQRPSAVEEVRNG